MVKPNKEQGYTLIFTFLAEEVLLENFVSENISQLSLALENPQDWIKVA